MKCFLCKGDTVKSTTTYMTAYKNCYIIIKNVPCQKCSQCGEEFCDFKLKVWSAPVNDLSNWTCHGDIFRSKAKPDKQTDTPWTERQLYAPDVVEKDGKYYLYAYLVDSKGCVAVSDRPEGPFKLLSQYKYNIPNHYDNGTFIDPGVLVDDDGLVVCIQFIELARE